jgi:hypothetical protein
MNVACAADRTLSRRSHDIPHFSADHTRTMQISLQFRKELLQSI